MNQNTQKLKLIDSLGLKNKTFKDIYELENGEVINIKFSKVHDDDHYWFTVNLKNIDHFEKYSVSHFIFTGPMGYYKIPIQLLTEFFSSYSEEPADGKYHFGVYFLDHTLKRNKDNIIDIKSFYESIPYDIQEEITKSVQESNQLNLHSQETNRNYFSFKTNLGSIEDNSPDGEQEFVFEGISWHQDKTKKGDIVFFVQHGDNPPWTPGLSAICEITQGPFDVGYDRKYYRVKLKPLLILPKVINRDEFIGYFDCYNITFIGPMTKGEPNQSNNLMKEKEARHLVGALLDIFPNEIDEIERIFGSSFSISAKRSGTGIYPMSIQENSSNQISLIPENKINNEPFNLILYGAPGTGKSYELNNRVKKYFNHSELFTRITFHSNYSYRNFVGSYKPKPIYTENGRPIYDSDRITPHKHQKEPIIEYSFEPGPFLRMLVKALNHPTHNFLILIEELNRANSASVFGDIFQLLDRNDSGESEYSITLEPAAMDYLKSVGVTGEITIPRNLYLWATMNNADQGVLPLDTAFKRRWSFEHIEINANMDVRKDVFIDFPFLGEEKQLEWNTFRSILNDKLTEMGIHEDKLIGPFFLSKLEIENANTVKNKLLLYLKEDVLRYKTGIFKGSLKTFSMISKEFDNERNIFDDNIDWFE